MADALTREGILAAPDIVTEEVFVAEWGGKVSIRRLTGEERDRWEQVVEDNKRGKRVDVGGLKAHLIILSAVDADGKKLFRPSDAEALNAKSSRAIADLFAVSARLSGLTSDDVGDLLGNSNGDRNGEPGSS